MGVFFTKESYDFNVAEKENRIVFVKNVERIVTPSILCTGRRFAFRIQIYYLRYRISILKKFREVLAFEKVLRRLSRGNLARNLPKIPQPLCSSFSVEEQKRMITFFLQHVCDDAVLLATPQSKFFFGVPSKFPNPELGRVGMEGYLRKTSGGYGKKFSTKLGSILPITGKRYFILRDNHIAWYMYPPGADAVVSRPRGVIQIDNEFTFRRSGRRIILKNGTRTTRLIFFRTRTANEWFTFMQSYYSTRTLRMFKQPRNSSYPVRELCDAKAYTVSRDYMSAVAVALLQAQKEIFITSWKNSPQVLLTRYPLPPLRLDQILKFKADQGVKIYILLYKEVEMAGQGNDSFKAIKYLESLSRNIECMRHPNKFIGGSTAILWSHHEKLVVIDRNVAFVGGIDLAFNRWDDEKHEVSDELGLRYPGKDYRQPGPGKFPQTARRTSTSDLSFVDRPRGGQYDLVNNIFSEDDDGDDLISGLDELESRRGSTLSKASSDAAIATNTLHDAMQGSQKMLTKMKSQMMDGITTVAEKFTEKTGIKFEVRDLYPRMGWHDLHCGISGLAARDVSSHFVKRWNHHRIAARYTKVQAIIDVTDDEKFGICAKCQAEDILETALSCPTCGYNLGPISYFLQPLSSSRLPKTLEYFPHKIFRCHFIGQSTGVFFEGDCPTVVKKVQYDSKSNVETCYLLSETENVVREEPCELTPQVGDVVVSINDYPVLQLDFNQIGRILLTLKKSNSGSDSSFVIVFRRHMKPTTGASLSPLEAMDVETQFNMSRLLFNPTFSKSIIPVSRTSRGGTCKVQVLRSLGPWSGGIDREQSIMNGYNEAITNAKKFIYIENQFFIGNLAGKDVQNTVAATLLERLITAAKNNEDFRVIVVIPQHPNGDVANSVKPRIILNFQLFTICRGPNSLIEKLKSEVPGVDYRKYISFHCLRTKGFINDKLYSDQIYVHDKLLIVDDQVAIIGSANINDRSLLGDRDSEVAVRIEDADELDIILGRAPWTVGRFAHELRIKLMRQHLGDDSIDITDILDDEIYAKNWDEISHRNSRAFDAVDGPASVYRCKTLESYQTGLRTNKLPSLDDSNVTDILAKEVRGFLVNWPMLFLEQEDLAPTIATQYIIPNDLWV